MSVTLPMIIIIIIIIRFVKRQNVKRLPWRGGLHTAWLQGVVTGIGFSAQSTAGPRNWQWSSLLNVNDDQSAQRDKPLDRSRG